MSGTPDTRRDPAAPPDVADKNVELLLGKAYRPEAPDPAFVRRVHDHLQGVAKEAASRRAVAGSTAARPRGSARGLACLLAVAATLLALTFGLNAVLKKPGPAKDGGREQATDPGKAAPAGAGHAEAAAPAHLAPRPTLPRPPMERVAVGDTIRTAAGQRRRVTLPDDSVLYVNQKTTVKIDAERRVTLSAGEVFVEVSPRSQADANPTFVVHTDRREVAALGTKFAVRADTRGTGVFVTQGKVKVSGVAEPVSAGQRLEPQDQAPAEAPRASHLLGWARDLVCAAEAPLLPPNQFAGGALVASDPFGQPALLKLRKYHVDVHIEDGFARTTIDQTYFNESVARLEGTFYFPLPPDASLSRLAMYVDGNLMEGGMAERDCARQVYESIVRKMQDPALLEWVDGSTFKMRVFPLEGRQEKRIILSYTQKLPTLYGKTTYRFPAGHSLERVNEWSFHARVRNGANLAWSCDTHPLKAAADKRDLVLDGRAKQVKVDRDIALSLFEEGRTADREGVARFSSFEQDGYKYLMVRYRPALSRKRLTGRRDWVFLFEASADRAPLLARAQVEVVRGILKNAEHDDTFAVVTAGARAHTFATEAKPCTPENVAAAVRWLEETHLVGALDLGGALKAAEPFIESAKHPYLVHLGGGLASLGERRPQELAKRVPGKARYVGVAVGKRWSRALMKPAAERTGGYHTQINPDEPVAWRAFELYSTLATPRLLNAQVVDDAEKAPFLCHSTAVAQGEELCAITRVRHNAPLPKSLTINAVLDGKPYRRTLKVKDVAGKAGYLPRTWAKLEIDRLLADNPEKHKPAVVALSKAMYVMTPFTSLLVLENEAMYKQFHVDRGRKDHWAMYPCPPTIPVIKEPLTQAPPAPAPRASRPEKVLRTIQVRVPPHVLTWSGEQPRFAGRRVVTAWELIDAAQKDANQQQPPVSWLGHLGNTPDDPAENSPLMPTEPGRGTTGPIPPIIGPTTVPPMVVPPPGTVLPSGGVPPVPWPSTAPAGGLGSSNGLLPGGFPGGGPLPPMAFSGGMPGPASGGGGWGMPVPPGGIGSIGGFNGGGLGGFGPIGQMGLSGGPGLGGMGGMGHGGPGSGNRHGFPGQQAQPLASYYQGLIAPPVQTTGGAVDAKARYLKAATERTFDEYTRTYTAPNVTLESLITSTKLREHPLMILNGAMREKAPLGEELGYLDLSRLSYRDGFFLTDDRPAAMPSAGKSPLAAFRRPAPAYARPTFSGNGQLFTDLLVYAPGMNTSLADIRAVLEAEAGMGWQTAVGHIDPAARALIDRARALGWQRVAGDGWSLAIDGAGRFVQRRTLTLGLQEIVVCDGRTILHLYPEIGVGACRTVSWFHRAETAALVPWLVLPAEDLARGADVKSVDDRTVAVVPRGIVRGAAHVALHLVFAEDGRLAERRHVLGPSGKLIAREAYAADGTVRRLDADGKDLATRKLTRSHAAAPDLTPDLEKFVILPMPLRTREHVRQQRGLAVPLPDKDVSKEDALAALAADLAEGNVEFGHVLRNHFLNRGDRRAGLYTIASAYGVSPAQLPLPTEVPPVVSYLLGVTPTGPSSVEEALNALRGQLPSWLGGWRSPAADRDADGLLAYLAAFWELAGPWRKSERGHASPAEGKRLLAYLRRCPSPAFTWALAATVAASGGRTGPKGEVLRTAAEVLADVPGLGYVAEYEYARHLLEQGNRPAARDRFRALHNRVVKAGFALPVDAAFRQAIEGDDKTTWADLVRRAGRDLAARGRRLAVLDLARQCSRFEERPLADELTNLALAGIKDDSERLVASLTAIDALMEAGRLDRADELLQPLLDHPRIGKDAGLWRLGVAVSFRRRQTARGYDRLERALDLEYRCTSGVVNLQTFRQDYTALLGHFEQQAAAYRTLGQEPPADFAGRVVRAADRWRRLESDPSAVCQTASRILRAVGARDLAWDYLTTALASRTGEPTMWQSIGVGLRQEGEPELAARAFRAAFESHPGDGQLLWETAAALDEAGKQPEARELYRQIKEGRGVTATEALRQQAAQRLGEP